MKGLNKNQLEKAASSIKAITHPLRMKILNHILKNEPVQVSKIYKGLKLEQSVTSSHLKVLRDAGFVTTKRDGKMILYSINHDKMGEILDFIKDKITAKK